MEYTTPWPTLVQMLFNLSHISFRSFRSIILKRIWSLMPSLIIRYTIPTAIWSSFTSFKNSVRFERWGRGPFETRSYTSFLININLVMLNHTSQLTKSMSFSCLLWAFLRFEFLVISYCVLCFFDIRRENSGFFWYR